MDFVRGHADGATRTVHAAGADFAGILAKLVFIQPRFENLPGDCGESLRAAGILQKKSLVTRCNAR